VNPSHQTECTNSKAYKIKATKSVRSIELFYTRYVKRKEDKNIKRKTMSVWKSVVRRNKIIFNKKRLKLSKLRKRLAITNAFNIWKISCKRRKYLNDIMIRKYVKKWKFCVMHSRTVRSVQFVKCQKLEQMSTVFYFNILKCFIKYIIGNLQITVHENIKSKFIELLCTTSRLIQLTLIHEHEGTKHTHTVNEGKYNLIESRKLIDMLCKEDNSIFMKLRSQFNRVIFYTVHHVNKRVDRLLEFYKHNKFTLVDITNIKVSQSDIEVWSDIERIPSYCFILKTNEIDSILERWLNGKGFDIDKEFNYLYSTQNVLD
jgi:hypothetical protein